MPPLHISYTAHTSMNLCAAKPCQYEVPAGSKKLAVEGDMSYARDVEIQGSSDDEPVALAAKKKTPVPKQQAPVAPSIPSRLPLGGLPPGFPARVPGMPDMAPRRDSNLVITMGLDNCESNPEGYNTSILADHIIADYSGQSSIVCVWKMMLP